MCDLLTLLDIFKPLKLVMERLQSYTLPPWKSVKYIDSLLEHLRCMKFSDNLESCKSTPLFCEHLNDVQDMKFKGKVFFASI